MYKIRLGQVLINLVSNAIKYSEKGTILIKVRIGDSHPFMENLVFEVSDEGIGIPVGMENEIFKRKGNIC